MKHFIVEITHLTYPEQYNVFLDGEQIGYLRLIHGIFRCDYLTCGGEILLYYTYCGSNDTFPTEEERNGYISQAIRAMANKLNIKDYDIEIYMEDIN